MSEYLLEILNIDINDYITKRDVTKGDIYIIDLEIDAERLNKDIETVFKIMEN